MKYKAIIFDVDGTLTDTNQIHVDNWSKAFSENNLEIDENQLKLEIGKGGDNLVPDMIGFKPDKKIEEKLNESKAKEFKKSAKEIKFIVFPKAIELIKALKEKDIKTAIATSATKSDFKLICDNTDVDFKSLVDVLVTSEDVKDSKPDPDIIHATLKKLELAPEDCLMVGDTPHDVEAAKKAQVKTLAVSSGFHSKENLQKSGALAVYKNVEDILNNLDKIL